MLSKPDKINQSPANKVPQLLKLKAPNEHAATRATILTN